MAFVMLLACLFKVGALNVEQDEPAVGLVVFDRWLFPTPFIKLSFKL